MAISLVKNLNTGYNLNKVKAELQGNEKKIKVALNEKNQELQRAYSYIGMEMFQIYKAGKLVCSDSLNAYFEKADALQKEVNAFVTEIQRLEQEIKRLELEIQNTGKIICSSCGFTLNSKQKYCPNCGKFKEFNGIICSCGQQIKKDMQFCPSCGKRVAELGRIPQAAPQAVPQIQPVAQQAQPVAQQAQPVAQQAQMVAQQAQPIAQQAQPVAQQAQPVAQQVQPAVPQSQPVVQQAQPAPQTNVKECICGAKVPEGQYMCLECGRKVQW